LITGALLVTLIAHGLILFEYYLINGDSTSIVLWLNSLTLEKMEPNTPDIMLTYANYFVSAGTKAIYGVLNFFMEPIMAVKIVPLITTITCTLLIYEIGISFAGPLIGNMSGGIFILLAWYHRHREMFGSADAEEISHVLMLGFLLTFLKRRFVWTSLILLMSALTYPPLFVLEVGTLCVFFAGEIITKKRLSCSKKNGLTLIAGIIIAGGYLVSHVFCNAPDFLGPILTYQEVIKEPMFNIGGNTPMFGDGSLWERVSNDVTGIGMDIPKSYMLIIFFLSLSLPFKKFKQKLLKMFPWELWSFLIAGVILTILANFVLLKLYQPSRYIQIPLTVFLIYFVSSSFSCLDEISKRGGRIARYAFMISLLCIVVPRLYGHAEGPLSEWKLIEHIKRLPDHSFLAGHPEEMNGVGLYTKKHIFLTSKMSTEVYWKKYRATMTERTEDFFDAYYAESIDKIENFSKKYGITHIVLYADHFSTAYLKDSQNYYYNPFNAFIHELLRERKNYYFNEKILLYQEKNRRSDVFVFDCKKMKIVYDALFQERNSAIVLLGKRIAAFLAKWNLQPIVL